MTAAATPGPGRGAGPGADASPAEVRAALIPEEAMYRRAAGRLTGQAVPADEPLAATKARLGL